MEPLSITTGIITLYSTLLQLKKFKDSYTEAPQIILAIERDCSITLKIICKAKSRLDQLGQLDRVLTVDDHINYESIKRDLEDNIKELKPQILSLQNDLRRFLELPNTNFHQLKSWVTRPSQVRRLKDWHGKIVERREHFERLQRDLDSENIVRILQRQSWASNSPTLPDSSIMIPNGKDEIGRSLSASTIATSASSQIAVLGPEILLDALDSGQASDVVMILKDGEVDPNFQTGEAGMYPLHIAAARGDHVSMAHLLDFGANIEAQDYRGKTPLHIAAKNDRADALQLLVNRRADPNAHDNAGRTALWYAAGHGTSHSTLALPTSLGTAVINHRCADTAMPNPLWAAAARGQVDTATTLLRAGADPNATDAQGSALLNKEGWPHVAERDRGRLLKLIEASESSPDPTHEYRKITLPNTCQWIQQNPKFKNWFKGNQSPCLWCYGKPGVGKTVLASRIVAKFHDKRSESSLVYFFCGHSTTALAVLGKFIGTLISQLKPAPVLVKKMVEQVHNEKACDEDKLIKILLSLAAKSHEAVFILDGLDECRPREWEKILGFFKQLLQTTDTNSTYKVFISSREDFSSLQQTLPCVGLSIHDTDVKEDIRDYVKKTVDGKVEERQLRVCTELAREIKEELINRAEGMFLWVKVKIEDLCAAQTDGQISRILDELPEGLHDTYCHCLGKIAKNREPLYAFNILRWVSHARRPLLIEELEEAIIFDPKDGRWDTTKRPNISIVEICANLVIIDEIDETKRVRLAHPTVKQFLEKPAEERGAKEFLKKIDHNELSTFNFGPNDLEVGEYCISYLFASEFQHYRPAANRSRSSVNNFVNNLRSAPEVDLHKYKLLTYAKEHWAYHTLAFSENSLVWDHFRFLALRPEGPWAGRPLNSDNSRVEHYYRQFQWAIENGHITLLRLLRDNNQEVFRNLCSQKVAGDDFHLIAEMNGRENIAEILLEGVDINSTDDLGQTALHRAAAKGHEAAAKLLLAKVGVDLEFRDYCGRTPLSWAAENGREAVAGLLLARTDVDVDSKDNSCATPLSWAAGNGHAAVVQLLLAKDGVNINSRDTYYGRTPLSWAAGNGHRAVATLLLAKGGVDVSSKDRSGRTPLSWAAGNGYAAEVELLLAKDGVNINSRDTYYGWTPLSWAAGNGHRAVAKLLLAKGGVDVSSKDKSGRTPLSWAAGNGHAAEVELLLAKKGVAVDFKDKSGQTPLSWAAGNGHAEVVKLLLAKGGIDVDSKDKSCRTPLSWAAGNGHAEVAKLLLAKGGVDVDSKDRSGRTPLSWAARSRHAAIVELLQWHNSPSSLV